MSVRSVFIGVMFDFLPLLSWAHYIHHANCFANELIQVLFLSMHMYMNQRWLETVTSHWSENLCLVYKLRNTKKPSKNPSVHNYVPDYILVKNFVFLFAATIYDAPPPSTAPKYHAPKDQYAGHLSAEEMDQQRRQNIAYEYLCHLEESKV